jgi:putative transport protein
MLLATAIVLRRGHSRASKRQDDAPQELKNLTIRVEPTDRPRVQDVVESFGGDVVFSRLRHGETTSVLTADEDERLEAGDLVTVVGAQSILQEVAIALGHPSSHTLVADPRDLDFRRITLSNRACAGRTLNDLDMPGRFGAVVTRVRRGDIDMVASDDLVVQSGDRLRVIAASEKLKEASAYLGDSERGLSDINPVGLALGLTLGILLGAVHVPLPGGGFEIGAAGGTLLVGLAFGRLGRVGPVMTTLAHPAASALSNFGMLAFLAYAGTKAGGSFTSAVTSSLGWRIAVVEASRLAGIVAGLQTQPAVLAFADERTGFDTRVALGCALVYPAAMVVKIVLAQVLAGL